MGFLSGIFGGGGSSSSSQSSTTVDVDVNPAINVVNAVDLGPVQQLVDHLTKTQTRTAALGAIEAGVRQQSQRELVEGLKNTTLLAVVGAGALIYFTRKAA